MLYPVPMNSKDPLGPWEIVNSAGYSIVHGFPTKHHAWHWIIGPTYHWPKRRLHAHTNPRKARKRSNRKAYS